MRILRLRGRKTCDRLLRQGSVWKGRTMVVRWMVGHPRHPSSQLSADALYVGTIASTKLDKSAVTRNRMRRRCREALRVTCALLPADHIRGGMQLLIAPRSSSLKAPFEEIQADIRGFLSSRAHVHAPEARLPRQ